MKSAREIRLMLDSLADLIADARCAARDHPNCAACDDNRKRLLAYAMKCCEDAEKIVVQLIEDGEL